MKTVDVLSLQVATGGYRSFLESLLKLPEERKSSYVCFANVHLLVECHRNPKLKAAVDNAALVAADGKPIMLCARIFGEKLQEKVSGPDIFLDLLQCCEQTQKKVFFYGSTERVLTKIVQRASADFPRLKIAGTIAPPFRPLTEQEKVTIASHINSSHPDFILVALGCPKQELWMAEFEGLVNGCMLGVGQAFQIYAGLLKRSPLWMQHGGLEWLFRLIMEPKRLMKRYLLTNSVFLLLLFRKALSSIRF